MVYDLRTVLLKVTSLAVYLYVRKFRQNNQSVAKVSISMSETNATSFAAVSAEVNTDWKYKEI